MAERKVCPKCGSGNVYVLVTKHIVCRACDYDGREEQKKKEVKK